MISLKLRFAGIALTAVLAACGAKAGVPSGTNTVPNAASVVTPNIEYKFYIKNTTDDVVSESPFSEQCMKNVPKERELQPGHEYAEDIETSNDPECILQESRMKFEFFVQKNNGGWGAIKWSKQFLESYTIKTVEQRGLCFGQSGGGSSSPYIHVKIRRNHAGC